MAVNPKSLKNLIPPKKGEVRNPKGKPPKLPDLDVLLAEVLGEQNPQGIEAAKAILMAMRAKAAKGDVRAAEALLDRAYGKPQQSHEVKSSGNHEIIVKYERKHNDNPEGAASGTEEDN